MGEHDVSSRIVPDKLCLANLSMSKPVPLHRACPATAPCIAGPHCFASGGGWTGFDSAGPAGCGKGGKTNMDGGNPNGIHICSCRTDTGPWVVQRRGATQDAFSCKN